MLCDKKTFDIQSLTEVPKGRFKSRNAVRERSGESYLSPKPFLTLDIVFVFNQDTMPARTALFCSTGTRICTLMNPELLHCFTGKVNKVRIAVISCMKVSKSRSRLGQRL